MYQKMFLREPKSDLEGVYQKQVLCIIPLNNFILCLE